MRGEKTLWENEKMLVTSIFSFSHSVFKSPYWGCYKSGLCGWELKDGKLNKNRLVAIISYMSLFRRNISLLSSFYSIWLHTHVIQNYTQNVQITINFEYLMIHRTIFYCHIMIVAPPERWHCISVLFWKVPMEAAILFAGSRLAPPKISSPLGLFISSDCTLIYWP